MVDGVGSIQKNEGGGHVRSGQWVIGIELVLETPRGAMTGEMEKAMLLDIGTAI